MLDDNEADDKIIAILENDNVWTNIDDILVYQLILVILGNCFPPPYGTPQTGNAHFHPALNPPAAYPPLLQPIAQQTQ